MEEADYLRSVGGRFSKQGNLFTRFVLGSHRQVYLCSALACQHFESLYRSLIGVHPHIPYPDILNNTLLSRLPP